MTTRKTWCSPAPVQGTVREAEGTESEWDRMTASSKELARMGSGCGHVRVAAGDRKERAVARTSDSGRRHMLPGLSPGYIGDDDYPSWTWDPTSGEDLTKGTTTAAWPGWTLSWAATARNPEVPSSGTQRLPDTGEGLGRELVWVRMPRAASTMESQHSNSHCLAWQKALLLPGPYGPSCLFFQTVSSIPRLVLNLLCN